MIRKKRNNSEHFKREVLIEIAKMFFENRLERDIHKIPYNIIPKNSEERFRCCIYKERAIINYRALAAMGYSINGVDESAPLNSFVSQKDISKSNEGKLLTVLESACKSCMKSQFMITEVCQGCLNRGCMGECHFKAIDFKEGRAHIDQDKCKNCGKCLKACPYGAILKLTVPCEQACPTDAIKKDHKDRAHIDHSACISCGRCMKSCPFGAIMERGQILHVLKAFGGKKPVVAMIAPAIAGQFGVSMGKLAGALKEIGFSEVYEVALGADITAENEAQEFEERVIKGKEKFMTSSCCYAYIRLVQKHLPELQPYISHTKTPMYYTAQAVKKEMPGALTVFVGPCLSKRKEGQTNAQIDFVLNFEELNAMLIAKKIHLDNTKEVSFAHANTSAEARRFPLSGGVTKAVCAKGKNLDIKAELINGLDQNVIYKLKAYAKNGCGANFLEIMSCQGGCVGGPDVIEDKIKAAKAVDIYADDK